VPRALYGFTGCTPGEELTQLFVKQLGRFCLKQFGNIKEGGDARLAVVVAITVDRLEVQVHLLGKPGLVSAGFFQRIFNAVERSGLFPFCHYRKVGTPHNWIYHHYGGLKKTA
jgi:hypothetical protein